MYELPETKIDTSGIPAGFEKELSTALAVAMKAQFGGSITTDVTKAVTDKIMTIIQSNDGALKTNIESWVNSQLTLNGAATTKDINELTVFFNSKLAGLSQSLGTLDNDYKGLVGSTQTLKNNYNALKAEMANLISANPFSVGKYLTIAFNAQYGIGQKLAASKILLQHESEAEGVYMCCGEAGLSLSNGTARWGLVQRIY